RRNLLERGAGIGDRGETSAVATRLFPEVLEMRERLERRPGLRGHDEQCPVEVEQLLGMPDHRRMRRVENVEALASERALQDLGRERGAAHAEQDERLEARPRLLCELADLDN